MLALYYLGRKHCSIMKNQTDKEKIEQLEHKIAELELQVEELECKLQGLIKCIECHGNGGRHAGSTGRLGHPQDPQTWENCKACDGEGWVKG